MPARVILIAALADTGVIGIDNRLPWRLKADMRRFRKLTTGHPILMGRKTWDSLGGKPLPKRRNVVITRQESFSAPGAEIAASPQAALALAAGEQASYVIGGAEIYRQFLPMADRLELTRVHDQTIGSITFPPINWQEWQLAESKSLPTDDDNEFAVTFETWERR